MTHDIHWRKSSFSGGQGNCVEVARVPAHWRKSSYSTNQGNCVELADLGGTIGLRNNNHPDAGTLTLDADQMAALIVDVKAGHLDAHA